MNNEIRDIGILWNFKMSICPFKLPLTSYDYDFISFDTAKMYLIEMAVKDPRSFGTFGDDLSMLVSPCFCL